MLLALIVAASLSLLRPAAESSVSISPSALTFPEIARALSAPGRAVVCGAGLRNRAAVVALRNRSWEEARRALSDGLGVRMRPHPDLAKTWLMEADPEVESRERDLRMALVRQLQQAVEKEVAAYLPTLDQPIHRLMARSMAVHHALEERERIDPRHRNEETIRLAAEDESLSSLADPFAQIAARLSRTCTASDYEAALHGPQPFHPVNIHRIADVDAICRLMAQSMARDEASRPAENEASEPETGNPLSDDRAMLRLLQSVAQGRIAVYQRLYVSPMPFRVTVQQLYVFGDWFAFRHGISAVIDDGDARIERVLARMSPEAKARMEEDRRTTAAWLATRAANQPFALRWTDEIVCLSTVVEEWARQTGGEVVMELAPGSEGIGMLHSPETGGDADPPPSTIRATLATAARSAADYPWSFSDSSGVLIVGNPLDFVDRTRAVPIGPLLRLERARTRPGSPAAVESGPCTLAELARFHAACTPDEAAVLTNCLSPYRGLDIQNMASSRFAAALDRLSPTAQASVARQLEATGQFDVPLTAFSFRDHQEIMATLRAASMAVENGGDDAAWLRDFPRLLRAGTLRLVKGDGNIEASLLIPPPIPRIGEPATLATATFASEPRR